MGKFCQTALGASLITALVVQVFNIGFFIIQQRSIPKVQVMLPEEYKEIVEARKKTGEMPEIPLTVVSRKGHHIHLGEPIGHSEPRGGYYEFPVTLLDDKGKAYRIDIYDFLNKYAGKTVRIEK